MNDLVIPVGEAVCMSGTNGGFTMCVFKSSDVPLGTKLYAGSTQYISGISDAEDIFHQILDEHGISGETLDSMAISFVKKANKVIYGENKT